MSAPPLNLYCANEWQCWWGMCAALALRLSWPGSADGAANLSGKKRQESLSFNFISSAPIFLLILLSHLSLSFHGVCTHCRCQFFSAEYQYQYQHHFFLFFTVLKISFTQHLLPPPTAFPYFPSFSGFLFFYPEQTRPSLAIDDWFVGCYWVPNSRRSNGHTTREGFSYPTTRYALVCSWVFFSFVDIYYPV